MAKVKTRVDGKTPFATKSNSERQCGGNKPATGEMNDQKKASRITADQRFSPNPVPDNQVFGRRGIGGNITDGEVEKHGQKKSSRIGERARYA